MDEFVVVLSVVITSLASAAAWVALNDEEKIPRNTGLKGREMIRQMLAENNPARVRDFLRMSKAVFQALCFVLSVHGLRETTHMSVEEQVAIFLYICGGNYSNRTAMETFQRSGDTISR